MKERAEGLGDGSLHAKGVIRIQLLVEHASYVRKLVALQCNSDQMHTHEIFDKLLGVSQTL